MEDAGVVEKVATAVSGGAPPSVKFICIVASLLTTLSPANIIYRMSMRVR
jgi:hypothetical protein